MQPPHSGAMGDFSAELSPPHDQAAGGGEVADGVDTTLEVGPPDTATAAVGRVEARPAAGEQADFLI